MKKTLFALLAVVLSHTAFATATQVGHWRWRNDDGGEAAATWKAAANNQVTINDPFAPVRLRISIYSNYQSDNGSLMLQYTTNADAASPSGFGLGNVYDNNWIDIPAQGTATTAAFTLSSSAFITGTFSPTTNQLGTNSNASSPNDPFSGGAVTTSAYATSTVQTSKRYEVEFTIKPTSNIDNNKVYYFRYKGVSGGAAQVPQAYNYLSGVPNLKTGANIKVTNTGAALTVFLGGPFVTATSTMTTLLANSGLLPTTFGGATVSNINALTVGGKRVTDWVTVQLSNAATPGTPTNSYPALLLSNGSVVSPVSPYNNLVLPHVNGNFVITVKHRNHLAAAKAVTLDNTMTTTTVNLSTGTTTSQKAAGALKVMWPGDINQDGEVGASDISPVTASFLNGDAGTYNNADLDMDAETGASDVGHVKNSFLNGAFMDYGDL
ncbi:hypothetical protein [Taibaiella chishuiensis]|uniref:Dockerin domain-containing protein n=1 Tax=Taibaiella chishuiensis TaxID=1434707 RepID=A0A2P8D2Q1_9BACT|nr:hypothetical protein [Taibaiella chishuiensis]PSK91493.1 hypothetical protein B0I18_10576 [Taibaiella chishuiensis]